MSTSSLQEHIRGRYPRTVRLINPDYMTIGGQVVGLAVDKWNTALKQCPFVPGYMIRLVMPRVQFKYFSTDSIGVISRGFGEGWEEIDRPINQGGMECQKHTIDSMENGDAQLKDIVPISQLLARAEQLHEVKGVKDQLARQTELFVEKSDFFSGHGMCPPIRAVWEVELQLEDPFWPNRFGYSFNSDGKLIWDFNIQITQQYLDTHGSVYAVELEDAMSLPKGTWNDDGTHHKISSYKGLDHHPSNIVNGYYVDWEIYGWGKEVIS